MKIIEGGEEMFEGRVKLILAILLAIGIVLIITNTASAFEVISPINFNISPIIEDLNYTV